ncbi:MULTISPECIES: DUF3592 domain-containing protein [Acidiphilium]|uniref:DUF3592 domain-containing protein n=1 Tax=Acidiphilium TaxID=522 RepID=UPI0009714636|nr:MULTISPECIES: DUF3592 domain-containing protein [Acidiphilium]
MRLLFGLLGVCLLIAAGVLAHQRAAFVKTASFAVGTAIKSKFGSAHPDIRFTTRTGQIVTFPQGGAVRVTGVQHIRVIYDPAKPEETACVDRPGAVYFSSIMLAVIGSFMLAVLVLPALFVKR